MKRTAAAFVLVAGVTGLTGCISTPSAKPAMKSTDADARQARTAPAANVQQAGGFRPVGGPKKSDVINAAYGVDRTTGSGLRQVNNNDYPPEVYGPMQRGVGTMMGHGGITPVPQMGPPGAVALVPGAMSGPGGVGMAGMFSNGRTSVRFAAPAGMKIAFYGQNGFGDGNREAPVRYNFVQGNIYRLRLNGIPNRPGKNYYPTLEVYPANADTITFLSHTAVPVGFTDEDFEQVNAGNMVVKVIYLPSATFQDVAVADEIVSTKLEPGVNPIDEANRRGTILAVIRLGNIDLEDPSTPAMDAPPGSPAGPGSFVPSGPLPNGGMPSGPISGTPLTKAPALPPSTTTPAPLPMIEPKKAGEPVKMTSRNGELPTIPLPKVK